MFSLYVFLKFYTDFKDFMLYKCINPMGKISSVPGVKFPYDTLVRCQFWLHLIGLSCGNMAHQ